jgi:pyruvate/2-oxoglutarate dehydrogenase complex dihydrolipoamide acyltransferase (E2) component
MATKVIMPKLGLIMEEGTVTRWFKNEGDEVKVGDPLFEVTTEKLTNTIEADTDGILRKIVVETDETVNCLELLAVIADADEDISDLLDN